MAKARKCDRCGAYYDPYEMRMGTHPVDYVYCGHNDYCGGSGKSIDLCPNCMSELIAWLEIEEGEDE